MNQVHSPPIASMNGNCLILLGLITPQTGAPFVMADRNCQSLQSGATVPRNAINSAGWWLGSPDTIRSSVSDENPEWMACSKTSSLP